MFVYCLTVLNFLNDISHSLFEYSRYSNIDILYKNRGQQEMEQSTCGLTCVLILCHLGHLIIDLPSALFQYRKLNNKVFFKVNLCFSET